MDSHLSFLSLGGIGTVTRNLYVYEYGHQILLVDCGLGFPDETMLGVDFLLPDISYLQKSVKEGKKIVGMLLTHGHEDHMGGLPFILPQLPEFPIFATSFTAALANEKLEQFKLPKSVKEYPFGQDINIGNFRAQFIHVTHSVPDTAHIVITTPVGNFYHGSDFKFDLTPFDKKQTDFQSIAEVGKKGIRCLMSECLGAERAGFTPSEETLTASFENEIRNCFGKCIVTTYSSNISRINQISMIARKYKKKVGFVGRSLVKAVGVAREKGLLLLKREEEINVEQIKKHKDSQVLLFVAGSQGQVNSALTRIINGEHRTVELRKNDVVIFSADPIPGNEMSVYAAVDSLSRMGIKVIYSDISRNFHVSGHGSSQELLLLMSLLTPKHLLPISGTYRQMTAYKHLAKKHGFWDKDISLLQNGQQIIFTKDEIKIGQRIPVRNVYVDEVSGEEIEQFVLRDRQKISQEGIVAIILEADGEKGRLIGSPEITARGFAVKEVEDVENMINDTLKKILSGEHPVSDWGYLRREIRESMEKKLLYKLKRSPLVLPIIIEV